MSTTKQLQKVRLKMFFQQKGKCYYCQALMFHNVDQSHPQRLTLDHMFPKHMRKHKSRTSDLRNSVAACCLCNHSRGDLSFFLFIFNQVSSRVLNE